MSTGPRRTESTKVSIQAEEAAPPGEHSRTEGDPLLEGKEERRQGGQGYRMAWRGEPGVADVSMGPALACAWWAPGRVSVGSGRG